MRDEAVSIRVYLPTGRPDALRIAEISNWSGKALACPRSEIGDLLARPESGAPGIYLLIGTDPETGRPALYVGEAEVVASRLRSHQDKDFWVQAIVFVSKDENLTKAHIKFLEGELIKRGAEVGKAQLVNSQNSGARLPEADAADMHGYLRRVYQLLPLLGTGLFEKADDSPMPVRLECHIKGLHASGRRTPNGFIVFEGSQAVLEHRPSATSVRVLREDLLDTGVLERENGHLRFTRDFEFASPSAAASVVRGGNSNGLENWRAPDGRTLKELEAVVGA